MGEGGFEPPKLKAADLQSVPFGHSGTLPNPTTTTITQGKLFVKRKIKVFSTFPTRTPTFAHFPLDEREQNCYTVSVPNAYATVAQQVEQLTRNEQVARSNRVSSSKKLSFFGTRVFLSIAKAMVYHHALACISSTRFCRVVSHHTFRCVSKKLSQ